jgi:alkylation response protein AidB-like acyl-CoA dehydrogenase
MDFTFSEEQRMMAGALRTLLDDICAPGALRRVFEAGDATAGEERWQRLSELGLFGVLAPEARGGMGLADADFVLLAEEAGRAALPEPLAEQAGVAVPALSEALLAATPLAQVLERAARGSARIAVSHPLCPYVNVPPAVTHWLVCQGDAVSLYEAAEVATVPQASIDAGRRLVRPDLPRAGGERLAAGEAARALSARIANRAALYTAAQCLGVAERLIQLAVAYAAARSQFGKPIGTYQAIKHHLASAQVRLEFARPVVYAAVARVTELEAQAKAALSHAKLAAGDAADLAARTAMQVHGAMGYSWEVDLHFYMKRAWALAGTWGDRNFHARRVQSLVCGGAFALGPEETFT